MKKTIGIILAIAMIFSLTISAFAEVGDVTVSGHIGTKGSPTIDPDGDPSNPGNYDITYTTAVHWWVTQAAPTTVVNGDASGPDASVVNKIQNNNSSTQVQVSLDSFNLEAGDAENTTMQSYLNLRLTGDLAANGVGAMDLSTGYAGTTTYTSLLNGGAENAWEFGFGGTYNAQTLTTSYAPEYTMTLGFAFASE